MSISRGNRALGIERFEAFFHVMRIFGSVEPQIECNLPFPYIIILKQHCTHCFINAAKK